jgi:hypothetical protein
LWGAFASAYLPYDSDESPPTKEVGTLLTTVTAGKNQLINGCDANTYHILWGSSGTNPRGENLMEFM